uniref:Claudin n=1 Tax=Poecilia latipinna TaxID=48699 RepID=A0A3B3UMX9_9TELE
MLILGMVLAFIGLLGAIIICGLPTWKVTAFIGSNIITAQIMWEGLWMNCVIQSTGQMQCKVYDSLLVLPQDLQAARALIIIAIIVAVVGVLLGVIGGKCTNFVPDEVRKSRCPVPPGLGWGHHQLRAAYVECDRLRGQLHCDLSDCLGGHLDDLCGSKHRTEDVQAL